MTGLQKLKFDPFKSRAFGRVWFMALVLKTSTFNKVVGSNPAVPELKK
jgi:hypothetical protein